MKATLRKLCFTMLTQGQLSFLLVQYWRLRNSFQARYERELQILKKFVAKGDWVVDIGVNFCQYATPLSHVVGPSGRVVGFEAHPFTFNVARRIADQSNVSLYNLAVSDHDSGVSLQMGLYADGTPNFGTTRVTGQTEACVSVNSVRLDDFLIDRDRRISFIKCDIEGHEVSAISGAIELLATDRPVLLIETSNEKLAAIGSLLERIHYESYEVSATGDLAIKSGHEIGNFNVLFLPREHAQSHNNLRSV